MKRNATLHVGPARDALQAMPAGFAQTCVCSPPYWGLRSYLDDEDPSKEDELGLEATPQKYVQTLVEVFRDVRRALKEDGTLWLVLGDTYSSGGAGPPSDSSTLSGNGHTGGGPKLGEIGTVEHRASSLPEKNLVGIPWRVALALQEDGWYLRSDIIWVKDNALPESVTDRPTSSHEHIFLLSKSKQYFYDAEAIREDAPPREGRSGSFMREDPKGSDGTQPGQSFSSHRPGRDDTKYGGSRNKRDVWTVSTKPYAKAHYAVYPPDLIEPCVKAGSAAGDTVLDPFCGTGTTGLVALAKGRDFVGIDISRDSCEMAAGRIRRDAPLCNNVEIEGDVPHAE
jgi:DNA modification methylase